MYHMAGHALFGVFKLVNASGKCKKLFTYMSKETRLDVREDIRFVSHIRALSGNVKTAHASSARCWEGM